MQVLFPFPAIFYLLRVKCYVIKFWLAKCLQGMSRGHSGHLKEKYEHTKTGLEHLKYEEHKWIICVYLKIVNFLFWLQGGQTKFPCFLCFWDSRAKDRH